MKCNIKIENLSSYIKNFKKDIVFVPFFLFIAMNYVVLANLFAIVLLQTVVTKIQQYNSQRKYRFFNDIMSVLNLLTAGVALLTVYNIVF